MATILRSKEKLVVPERVRRQAGIKVGDRLEFRVSGRVISIVPSSPAGEDEYTPAQRRKIDAELKIALKGPYHGPFESAEEMAAYVDRKLNESRGAKKLAKN